MKKLGIFIFHRDLRMIDNLGLIELQKKCSAIIPIFIFDKSQLDKSNHYFSHRACKFLCEAVHDLNIQINDKLLLFYGDPIAIIKKIIKLFDNNNIVVGFNADFTKYALWRDNEICSILESNNIEFCVNYNDYTLVQMNLLLNVNNGTCYKKYNSFKLNLLQHKKLIVVDKRKIKFTNCAKCLTLKESIDVSTINKFYKLEKSYEPIEFGSRKSAQKILRSLTKFVQYDKLRDQLSYATTHISAYLNFGLISEREFYLAVKSSLSNSLLIHQIIWRDYYLCLLRYEPNANSYNSHIDTRYNQIRWKSPNSVSMQKEWNAMIESKTGFLLIDASIAELIATGFMHNRGRLIVGYFTVKYLHINPLMPWFGLNSWFSRYLVDCITSQNKLNCQFITELDYSGKQYSKKVLDGRPFNIDNKQIAKYDRNCIYIKKWLPHLTNVPNNVIYNWSQLGDPNLHPLPIFDAKERYQEWIKMCGKVK